MTGIADAAPRSPEAWKNMGCCADFPQPWADLMWGLEFEDKHPLARVFRQAGASVCEHDCPVRAECMAYAGAAGLEWGLYGGRSCTDRRQIARLAEADGVPCRDRTGALGPALGPVRRLAPSPSRSLRHGPGQGQHGTRATPMARRRPRPTQE